MKKGTIYPLPLINFEPRSDWSLLSETEYPLSLYAMHIVNMSNVPIIVSFDSLEGHVLCLSKERIALSFPIDSLDMQGCIFSRLYAKSYDSDTDPDGRCYINGFILFRGA